MKAMRLITMLAALSLSMSVMCQTNVTDPKLQKQIEKDAKKEAKKMAKEGWKVSPGALPLEKQFERCYKYMTERDDDGSLKYVTGMGLFIAESFDAARTQATELARLEIARSISTEAAFLVKKLVATNQLTKKEIDAIMDMQGEVWNINDSQKRISTWTVIEAYRLLSNNKKEVMVRLAIKSSNVKEMVKDGIREELLRRGIEISEQTLEKIY